MRAMCLGVLVLVGCGASQGELVLKQVDELKQQLVELRKSQASMSVTVEDLETRLFLVQDELDTYRKRVASDARREQDLPVVRVQPQNGPESVFDPSADRPRTVAQGDAEPVEFDRLDDEGNLIRANAKGAHDSAGTAPSAPQARAAPRAAVKPVSADEREAMRLYEQSVEQLKGQHYEDAIRGFQEFVERWPTHGYADNAMYWMGEAYYDRGLWMKALQTFQSVVSSFPLGNKVPDAMLKVGLCHQQLKNFRQAREVLEQVAQSWPATDVARIATTRLEKIP